jgi:hypothetical protein
VMLNFLLPSCSCIALKPLRLSRIGQRVGIGHALDPLPPESCNGDSSNQWLDMSLARA